MQFLWSLLPGAREIRNQVIIGYAWLGALGFSFGVPEVRRSGELHELVAAVGKIGVGIAVSFGAFLLGSVVEDILSRSLGARRALPFTVDQPGGLEVLDVLGDSGRRELERLEGSIDRASSELILRASLIPPLGLVAVVALARDFAVLWLLLFMMAIVALLAQAAVRYRDLGDALRASDRLRDQTRALAQQKAYAQQAGGG
jgi:hypothetical protein